MSTALLAGFYICFSIAIVLYTVKNRLDILSVANVCFIIYTIHCAIGFVYIPVGSKLSYGFRYYSDIEPVLYFLVYLQMLMMFAITVRNRRSKYINRSIRYQMVFHGQKQMKYAFVIFTVLVVLFTLVNVFRIGLKGLSAAKADVWAQTDLLYGIAIWGAVVIFTYGICNRIHWIWISGLLIVSINFYIGSRAFMATLAIVFILIYGKKLISKGKRNIKVYVLGALGMLVLLVYKTVWLDIKDGNFEAALRTLSSIDTWIGVLDMGEPRTILANYNYSLQVNIRLPSRDILARLLSIIPFANGLVETSSYGINYSSYLQDAIGTHYGLGSSIWGEGYAMFGYIGIFILEYIWLMLISKGNRALKFRSASDYFIVSICAYFSYYISRLDIQRILGSCKMMILVFFVWCIIYVLLGGRVLVKVCNKK